MFIHHLIILLRRTLVFFMSFLMVQVFVGRPVKLPRFLVSLFFHIETRSSSAPSQTAPTLQTSQPIRAGAEL